MTQNRRERPGNSSRRDGVARRSRSRVSARPRSNRTTARTAAGPSADGGDVERGPHPRDVEVPEAEARPSASGDFQQAVDRLERAVGELVGSAKGQFSDKAAAFIDETATKIEDEFATRKTRSERERARRRHRQRQRARRIGSRSRGLFRDPKNGKIGGVCAGIANYYGMESWVVRCIAITGLLFMGSIVFPAYWIAYFVMDKPPSNREQVETEVVEEKEPVHVSPAPELGPQLSPRSSLRNVEADYAEIELRLRRMESHVTSGQYELQKELYKIEEEGSGTSV